MSQRQRPFSGSPKQTTLDSDALRRIEDQFVGWLIQARCEVRPKRAWPWSPDLHHRIDLQFNDTRTLVSGENVDRKGPQMDWAPGTLHKLNDCVESALSSARGQCFPDAPAGLVSLYLPLRPID